MASNIMEISEIQRFLPHRYPFLLVDRVTDYSANEFITGFKNVSANEGFFQGHFPGMPIMPGVLVLEAMAQISGILGFITTGTRPNDSLIHYFAGCDRVRFKRPVVPGDQLELRSELIKAKHSMWKFNCTASVDGQVACVAEIMTAERER